MNMDRFWSFCIDTRRGSVWSDDVFPVYVDAGFMFPTACLV